MQGGVLHLEELAGSKSSERGRTRERGGGVSWEFLRFRRKKTSKEMME